MTKEKPAPWQVGRHPKNTPAKCSAVRVARATGGTWSHPRWADETFAREWATSWVTSTARGRWPDHPVTDQHWVDSIVAWAVAA